MIFIPKWFFCLLFARCCVRFRGVPKHVKFGFFLGVYHLVGGRLYPLGLRLLPVWAGVGYRASLCCGQMADRVILGR